MEAPNQNVFYALTKCVAAMETMRVEIDAIGRLFRDSDGVIAAACQAHDEAKITAENAIAEYIKELMGQNKMVK